MAMLRWEQAVTETRCAGAWYAFVLRLRALMPDGDVMSLSF